MGTYSIEDSWGAATDCWGLDGHLSLLYDVGPTGRGGQRLEHEISHGHMCSETRCTAGSAALGGCGTFGLCFNQQ